MQSIRKSPFFCLFALFFACLTGCTIDHAQEQVLSVHANGAKKTSIWVYSDGEIKKRNEWYSDGIKEFEIPYKDGVPHGDFKRWTGFGDVAMVGNYKKGLRNGKWVSYFSDKKVEANRFYLDDHPVGDWEGFHYNRNRAFEEHYNDKGDSVGVWKRWHDNGMLALENSCFGTTDSGFVRRYDYNGSLESSETCVRGKKRGEQVYYYSDGKKVRLREWRNAAGLLDGPRSIYLADGTLLKQEYWKNGERDSVWKWFVTAGSPAENSDTAAIVSLLENDSLGTVRRTDFGVCFGKVCAESTFVLDSGRYVLDGKLWYLKDGHSLRYEEIWERGDKRESRSFYPDSLGGQMANEGFWKDGKREGVWRNWYRSGILMDSLSYVGGERVGEQFSYDSTGKLTIHKTENGKNRPVIMHLLGNDYNHSR